jgi:hypothetical protein
MGLGPTTQGDEKRLCPAAALHRRFALPFVIPRNVHARFLVEKAYPRSLGAPRNRMFWKARISGSVQWVG